MYKKISMHLSLVLKQNVLSVFAILSLFAVACGDGGGGSSGGGSSTGGTTGGTTGPVTPFVVTPIPRSGHIMGEASGMTAKVGDYHSHFVVLNLATGTLPAGEYKLAMRKKDSTSDPEATAANISASRYALTRNLSLTGINLFFSYHLGGNLFDGTDDIMVNAKANLDNARVDATMIQPSSVYTLFALDPSGAVHTVSDFSTNAAPPTTNALIAGFPHDVSRDYVFKTGEIFLTHNVAVNTSVALSVKFNGGNGHLNQINSRAGLRSSIPTTYANDTGVLDYVTDQERIYLRRLNGISSARFQHYYDSSIFINMNINELP